MQWEHCWWWLIQMRDCDFSSTSLHCCQWVSFFLILFDIFFQFHVSLITVHPRSSKSSTFFLHIVTTLPSVSRSLFFKFKYKYGVQQVCGIPVMRSRNRVQERCALLNQLCVACLPTLLGQFSIDTIPYTRTNKLTGLATPSLTS